MIPARFCGDRAGRVHRAKGEQREGLPVSHRRDRLAAADGAKYMQQERMEG